MKKLCIFLVFILSFSLSHAGFHNLSDEELEQKANQVEKKLYFRYNATYDPKSNDWVLLGKVERKLKAIHAKKPKTLRKLYLKIEKKLTQLARQKRGENGEVTTQIDSRLYFLLEQINNSISDLGDNQDLGCQKGLAHMEENTCVSNTKNISNDSGTGYQKYDFINEKWGEIKMIRCNNGYTKSESDSGAVMCVED